MTLVKTWSGKLGGGGGGIYKNWDSGGFSVGGIKGVGGCAILSRLDSYAIALESAPGREIGCGDGVTRWGLFLRRGVQLSAYANLFFFLGL